MKCIVNGKIMQPDGVVEGQVLALDDRIIGLLDRAPSEAEVIDAGGGWVSPGLIDLHCHGFMGMDASRGDPGELRRMSEHLLKYGVTAWLPTTMTLPWPQLERCFAAVRSVMAEPAGGARVLGANAEGPFISPARKGAQSGPDILPPDAARLRPWADVVKLTTVAPEVEGALAFIRDARAMSIRVSMGHTDATADAAVEGFRAGIGHVTHLFNAMSPLNHRAPGAVGAALAEEDAYCELIADGLHVSPLLFPMLAKLKPERLVLITDSIQVAGLPDGPHEQQGRTVIVQRPLCHFPDGTIAGSALTLDRAVRNFAQSAGVPLWQAVNMASLHPARALGIDGQRGALLPGMDADLLIADREFHVQKTFVAGCQVYDRAGDL